MMLKGPAQSVGFLVACILCSAWVGWSLGLLIRHAMNVLGGQ